MESEIALDKLDENDINRLLDVQSYFHLIGVALPKNAEAILDRLLKEGFIKHRNKKYQITNLGALLFGKIFMSSMIYIEERLGLSFTKTKIRLQHLKRELLRVVTLYALAS